MRSTAAVLVAGALTCDLIGCGATGGVASQPDFVEGSTEAEDDEGGPQLPTELPTAVPWQHAGQLTVDDFGEAGWISVPFPADQRYVAVRTISLDADDEASTRACHRVVEARLGSGADLLPAEGEDLLPQHQRLPSGPGGGVFVLSSTGQPLVEADVLELRVALEDCALGISASRARFPGMPRTLRVDAAWESHTDETTASVGVRILRAEDGGWGTVADDPVLAGAWEVAVERFADAGIELRLEAEALGPVTGNLRYGADMLAFDPLLAEVRRSLQGSPDDARFVPLALVRCLEADDPTTGTRVRPMGQSTRIAGSLADPATPSLVVVSAGDCDGSPDAAPTLDAERHGLVLAHEIAHYLGLWHVDHEGDHLLAADDEQLMRSSIALAVEPDDAWLSAAQAEVLHRHPDVVLAP